MLIWNKDEILYKYYGGSSGSDNILGATDISNY